MERTLVHTAAYTLDIAEARSTDGSTHLFDWMYHNFGTLTTLLPTKPYFGFPQASGYQHLTGGRAVPLDEGWQVVFEQTNANMRVRMLGADGTTVVTGKGLGPDLRVPVPFVMARRSAPAARFVILYQNASQAADAVLVETAPGVFTVTIGDMRDQITLSGKYSFTRTGAK
jgi:hypothetical protein